MHSVNGDANVDLTTSGCSYSKGVIACSFLFIAVYGLTRAPGVWAYVSEIWPQGYRAKSVDICAGSNWAFNFALDYFVPLAFKKCVPPPTHKPNPLRPQYPMENVHAFWDVLRYNGNSRVLDVPGNLSEITRRN